MSSEHALKIVGYVHASTGEVIEASSTSSSHDHSHAHASSFHDDELDGKSDGSSSSDEPVGKKRKKHRKKGYERTCKTCGPDGRKTKKCFLKEEDCGGSVRVTLMCKCGKRAVKKGFCYDQKCGGEGPPRPNICKMDGCPRVAIKDGLCSNQQCTGKVHVRVPPRLCKFPGGCENQALASGQKSKRGRPGIVGRCSIHGGGPRCVAEGCPNGAVARTDSCVNHKGGIRCPCDLYSVAREGFQCFSCRKGTDRIKQLEMMVKDFLDKHEFLNMYSYYDIVIPCSSIHRRPDFIYLISETHVICIEVDEHEHRYYNRDCEIARVSEIMQACKGKPLFLIRFNPLVSLLGELKSTFDAFRTAVITPETPMLTVEFIGYKREYDVAAEMERVARERAAVAEAGAIELEEEMEMEEE